MREEQKGPKLKGNGSKYSRKSNCIGRAGLTLRACLYHAHHAPNMPFFRQPFTVVNAEHFHAFVVVEVGQQFWRDEEILATVRLASDFDHGVVDSAFSAHIHTLRTAT